MKISRTGEGAKEEMTQKLIDIFKDHIGIGNAISSEDLFLKVTKIHPEDIDFYERAYKWNLIRRMLSVLRKSGVLFVVMGTSYHYVLDTDEELKGYENRIDAMVRGLHRIKSKAREWVDSEQLRELKRKAQEKQKKKEKKILKVVAAR
jgi:hypothetical protein